MTAATKDVGGVSFPHTTGRLGRVSTAGALIHATPLVSTVGTTEQSAPLSVEQQPGRSGEAPIHLPGDTQIPFHVPRASLAHIFREAGVQPVAERQHRRTRRQVYFFPGIEGRAHGERKFLMPDEPKTWKTIKTATEYNRPKCSILFPAERVATTLTKPRGINRMFRV